MKSTVAAKILPAGAAIEDAAIIRNALSSLYETTVCIEIFVDSKNLLHSVVSQRHSMDESDRGGVSVIRFHYEPKLKTFA